jgi:hydrogenase expression/formation protein HypE
MHDDPSPEFQPTCPVPLSDHATVQLAHGGGGRLMRNLIEGMFLPAFGVGQGRAGQGGGEGRGTRGEGTASAEFPTPHAPRPTPPHDSAVLPVDGTRLAFTTDTFVVSPLFFPGGDIGKLAVYGTVNDLAMAGAKPAYLSSGFILEEGLPMDTLRRVVASTSLNAPVSSG